MTTVANEPRYKSFIRPVKFWQKTKVEDVEAIEEKVPVNRKKVVPLVESDKAEVYKLSRIDEGFYMPPSPTLEGKRDHWIDVQDMEFNLPGSECLTSRITEKHDFFTPSSFVETQPYVLTELSCISLSSDSSSMDDVDLSD
ncbi:hypothetical protein G6F56_007297 [Rhizopus delemar]|uniref:Uncharacterized protein n=1 Tax=Rhizopus stolonifer TaxID=4846 RepID=A0A367ISG7_RHIST|nr:hypothetical protein G6F56_007297 [Rhizopus delemar]RCH80618.1 hypothetical protein CU098_006910 [Rhizopus stolonifer]